MFNSSNCHSQMKSILTKASSTVEIRRYFNAVLKLSQSDDKFPVNLDEVWPLVYGRKEEAVRALGSDIFIQGLDYQVLRKNAENLKGGRPTNNYFLSVSCLEYLIARKVRPVFEVYRKVFHATAAKKATAISNKKEADLKKRIEELENQLKIVKSISRQETDLKNSCFFYLVGKGLYTEWHEWNKKKLARVIEENIKRSIDS